MGLPYSRSGLSSGQSARRAGITAVISNSDTSNPPRPDPAAALQKRFTTKRQSHIEIGHAPHQPIFLDILAAQELPSLTATVPSGGGESVDSGSREAPVTSCRVFLGVALAVSLASASSAQTLPPPQADPQPTFRLQVWGYIVADFSTRVRNYFDLRTKLEEGLPPLRVTDDVAEIRRARRARAKAIQAARHDAREGDIFSPSISLEFKQVLALEMNAKTWAVIMDDNPGEFSHEINGIYPDGQPFSTVPGTILAALPTLPDGVEYRFLGRHLILLDVRAGVILDRIPYAIQCTDCDEDSPLHKKRHPRDC